MKVNPQGVSGEMMSRSRRSRSSIGKRRQTFGLISWMVQRTGCAFVSSSGQVNINRQQAPVYQYLAGYVEYYAGQYDAAIEALLKGDTKDPFILGLIAQAYDRKGDVTTAREYYSRVLASNAHSIPNAFSRPLARQRLEELRPSARQ